MGEMTFAGAIIVLAQVLSSFRSTQSVSSEIQKLREDLQQVQTNQEKYFVKKVELKKVVIKLDDMNKQLAKLNQQIKIIRGNYAFGFQPEGLGVN